MQADNSELPAKKKKGGPGKPLAKGYDPRRNMKGAPKRGESWAELYSFYGNLTPAELVARAGKVASKLKQYGDELTMKEIAVIRVWSSLLFEPTPGILNSVQDRMEGRVKEELRIDSHLDVENLSKILKEIYGNDDNEAQG